MTARIGVVLFPGSNCELDVVEAVRGLGGDAEILWHGDATLNGVDAVVVPGGFAHGDYLRPGAIARFSPVMSAITEFADAGGPVVGICNGFQVLTEAGLLPGRAPEEPGPQVRVLHGRTVVSRPTIGAHHAAPRWAHVLQIPINHFEGNYTCSPETLAELRAEDRMVLRYVDNPNGSVDDIAGVCSEGRNVVGLMPHPERPVAAARVRRRRTTLLRSLLHAAALRRPDSRSAPGAGIGQHGAGRAHPTRRS